jgi:hypothetical protein
MYVLGLTCMLKPAEKALGDCVDVKALKKASSTTPRSTTRLVDRRAAPAPAPASENCSLGCRWGVDEIFR